MKNIFAHRFILAGFLLAYLFVVWLSVDSYLQQKNEFIVFSHHLCVDSCVWQIFCTFFSPFLFLLHFVSHSCSHHYWIKLKTPKRIRTNRTKKQLMKNFLSRKLIRTSANEWQFRFFPLKFVTFVFQLIVLSYSCNWQNALLAMPFCRIFPHEFWSNDFSFCRKYISDNLA